MTVDVAFDKPAFSSVEPITFQVLVAGEGSTRSVTVTGSVVLTDATVVPASGTTTVTVTYGEFTADGYDVVQDPADPSHYTATPVA